MQKSNPDENKISNQWPSLNACDKHKVGRYGWIGDTISCPFKSSPSILTSAHLLDCDLNSHTIPKSHLPVPLSSPFSSIIHSLFNIIRSALQFLPYRLPLECGCSSRPGLTRLRSKYRVRKRLMNSDLFWRMIMASGMISSWHVGRIAFALAIRTAWTLSPTSRTRL
jgi:hypothetical protein